MAVYRLFRYKELRSSDPFNHNALTLRVVSVDLYFPQPCMKDSCSYSIVQIKCPKGQLDIKQQCVK